MSKLRFILLVYIFLKVRKRKRLEVAEPVADGTAIHEVGTPPDCSLFKTLSLSQCEAPPKRAMVQLHSNFIKSMKCRK